MHGLPVQPLSFLQCPSTYCSHTGPGGGNLGLAQEDQHSLQRRHTGREEGGPTRGEVEGAAGRGPGLGVEEEDSGHGWVGRPRDPAGPPSEAPPNTWSWLPPSRPPEASAHPLPAPQSLPARGRWGAEPGSRSCQRRTTGRGASAEVDGSRGPGCGLH